MLHRAKPLQNNNSLADEGQKKKKSPNMKHSYHKGALQKPLWRILIEEGLAKSSKKTALGEHRQVASL